MLWICTKLCYCSSLLMTVSTVVPGLIFVDLWSLLSYCDSVLFEHSNWLLNLWCSLCSCLVDLLDTGIKYFD